MKPATGISTNDTRRHSLKVLRALSMVLGIVAIAMALLADWLGFGQPGSFGIGQALLGLAGFALLLAGLLGKKVIDLYRGVAIILMNTLVLLGCLELGAIVISRFYQRVEFAGVQALPYYAAQDWTKTYWQEALAAESYQYRPFVIWSHRPFVGETVNISQEGVRQTTGAACSAEAYRVFVFGGSTMWGWGSPDWETIPAYLHKGLDALIEGPVCVVNLGEDGYVSTESLVALTLQLQSGEVPDAVIFYDGVNDVLAAYESGQAGVHSTLARLAAKFEEREHPLVKWIKGSRQYSLLESWVSKLGRREGVNSTKHFGYRTMDIDAHSLADSVTEVYLSNYRIVEALAQEYDFDCFFFWQPHLAIGEKPLTRDEQSMRSRMDPDLANLTEVVYRNIALACPEYERVFYIADAFDDQDKQIWIDEVSHVTPEGNRLIAERMLDVIRHRAMEH